MEPDKEIPLSPPMRRSWLSGDERSAVYCRGDVVVRDASPWAPSVHSFLLHLESEGFEAAPRLVGSGFDEQGREALQFVEGDILHSGPWSEDGAYELGRLVRKLHDAAARFKTAQEIEWPPCSAEISVIARH